MEWLSFLGILEWVRGVFSRRAPPGTIIVKDGGTLNVVQGDQHIHYHLTGPAEIVQPKPKAGRVIPLHVEFKEGVMVGESFDVVLEHKKTDGTTN